MAGFYESLNKQNYLKAMQGSYANYGITSDSINNLNSQQNIDASITLNDQVQKNINNAESAVTGENHDDGADWWDKSMNAVDNVFNNIFTGIFNFADMIGDAAMGIVGAIGGAAGNTDLENTMKNAINTDWQSNATQVINATNKTLRNMTGQNLDSSKSWWENVTDSERWEAIGSSEKSKEQLDKVKYGSDLSSNVVDTASNIAQGFGQMIPSLGIGNAVSGIVGSTGSALGASSEVVSSAAKTANIVTQASLGAIQGIGSGYSTVAREDGELTSGSIYAGLKGLIGAGKGVLRGKFGSLSDRGSDWVSDKVTGKLMETGLSDRMINLISGATKTLTDAGIDAGIDFTEELIEPALKQISYDGEALYKAYGNDENLKSTFANAGMVALTSFLTTTITDAVRDASSDESYVDKYLANHEEEAESLNKRITENAQKAKEAQKLLEDAGENATDEMKKSCEQVIKDCAEDSQLAFKEFSDLIHDAKAYSEYDAIASDDATNKITMHYDYDTGDDGDAINKLNLFSATNDNTKAENANTDTTAQATFDAIKDNFKKNREALDKVGIAVNIDFDKDAIGLTSKSARGNKYTFDILKSKEAKTTRIVAEFDGIGYTTDNGKMTIDTKTISTDDIEIIDTTINDSLDGRKLMHYKQNGKGGRVFDSYDNGVGIEMTSNGKVIKVYKNGETPKWADNLKVEVDENATYDGTDKFQGEKKALADKELAGSGAQERKLNPKASPELSKAMDSVFDGYKLDSKIKEKVIGMVTNSYALDPSDNETFSKVIDKSADELLQSIQSKAEKIIDPATGKERNPTLEEILTTDEVSQFKKDYAKAIQDVANLYGETSEKAELRNDILSERAKAQIVQNRLKNVIKNLDDRVNIINRNTKQYTQLRNKIAKSNSATPAGAYHENPEMLNTISDLGKTIKLANKSGQFSVDSIKKFISEHTDILNDYDTVDTSANIPSDIADLTTTRTGNEFIESVKEMNEYLSEHPDIKQFDNDGLRIMNAILSSANQATSDSAWKQRIANKTKVEGMTIDAQAYTDLLREEAKSDNFAKRILRNSTGLRYVLSRHMGEGEIGEFVIGNTIKDIQQEDLFESKQNKYLEDEMKNYKITDREASKSVTLTTSDGKEIKISKKKLYTLYMQEKTSDLSADFEKNGVTIYDEKTKTTGEPVKINQTDAQKWFDANLSDNEIQFLDKIYSEWVNNAMTKEMSQYTLDNFGYDVTEDNKGDYMPNSKDNLRHTLSDDNARQSSLGKHRTIRRTNNNRPSKLLDLDEVLTSYARDVGQLTRMDNVRAFNSLINLKDSKGMSIYNYYANNLPDGAKTLGDWQKIINGINDTKPLPKLFSNAMGVKVTANVGSIMKQPLDYIRQMKNVSVGDWFKGLANGVKALLIPSQHKALFSMLESESASYGSNINEKWYITANSVNGNISKVVEKLGKAMKGSNDLAWAMMYKSIESYVTRTMGYDSSTAEGRASIKADTLALLDTMSTKTLSNSASYDMSNYRSGRNGQIMQGLFSFWGDNQKNLENVSEIFLGNGDSRRRQTALENAISKKKEAISVLGKHLEKVQGEVEMDEEGNKTPTRKQTLQIEEYKARIEGLEASSARSQEAIQTEIKYRANQGKRVATVTSGIIASAMASIMISHLNSYLKGKEDPSEMATGQYWIDSAKDIGFEAGTSWIPFIGTLTEAIRNNTDVSLITLDGLNKTVDAISNAITYAKAGTITNDQLRKEMGSALDMLQNITGIPLYALAQYATGSIGNTMNIAGANGRQFIASMRGFNSAYLTTQTSTFLKEGNLTEATRYTQTNMYLYKGNNPDFATAKEITRVGASVSKTPDSLNGSQKETFNNFYKKATPQVKKLINSSAYKQLTDDEKKSAINYVYSAYYNASKFLVKSDDEETTTSRSANVLLDNSNADIGSVAAIIVKCKNKKKEQALRIINRSNLSSSQKKLARQLLGYSS